MEVFSESMAGVTERNDKKKEDNFDTIVTLK